MAVILTKTHGTGGPCARLSTAGVREFEAVALEIIANASNVTQGVTQADLVATTLPGRHRGYEKERRGGG